MAVVKFWILLAVTVLVATAAGQSNHFKFQGISTHTFSHKLRPKCGESSKYRARESLIPYLGFVLFIYLFFSFHRQ